MKKKTKVKFDIDYKGELEQAAKEMILIHDPQKLIREVVEMLVQKIKLKHAAALIYNKQKGSYVLTVSGGEKGFKIPEGFARLDPTSALIHLFVNRKNFLFSKTGVITYKGINELLKNRSLLNQERGLSEIILAAKQQMELYHVSVCLPVYLQGNELLGVLILGEKHSDKEFSEEELSFFAALANNIAMAVRNAQLHELEVRAEKLAGMTNLLDGFNHEFRNQINAVQFYLTNLDNPDLDQQDLKKYRPIALQAFENMLMILQSVYEYRLVSEKKEIFSTNLKNAIVAALTELKDKFDSIDAKITSKIPDLPPLETYKSFSYLFPNFFRNCYYALAQRKVRFLDIKVCKTTDNQRPIEIVINDSGGDMLEVIEQNISSGGEYFPERANVGGVNFFLAKHIVEDHNGELKVATSSAVNSSGDKGTVFTIRLPVKQKQSGMA